MQGCQWDVDNTKKLKEYDKDLGNGSGYKAWELSSRTEVWWVLQKKVAALPAYTVSKHDLN